MTESVTPFDEKKALGEEIQGLMNILVTLSTQTSHAERQAAEASAQYDALVKLKAFINGEIKRKREALQRLQAQG